MFSSQGNDFLPSLGRGDTITTFSGVQVKEKVYTFIFFWSPVETIDPVRLRPDTGVELMTDTLFPAFPFSPPFLMMAAAHRLHYCTILGSFALFCVKENWF